MKYKVALLGDSITQGIGSKKVNYVEPLQKELGDDYIIKNFAHTGTTINYAINMLEKLNEFSPDIIIVMYGNVDAQIRPNIYNNNIWCNIIPKRYKLNGMLDPRPFYSKKWYRYLPDRLDNMNRRIIRKYVEKTQGTCQWVSLEEFKEKYNLFLKNIDNKNAKIYLCSMIKLNEKYYKGCNEEYKRYNSEIYKLAKKYNHTYVDLYGYMEKVLNNYKWNEIYYFDHYHPNSKGYELIATLLSTHIKGSKMNVSGSGDE